MAGGGLRGGGEETPRRRFAVMKWLGLACILLFGAAGLYLLVADDPTGGEPIAVARIVSGSSSGESENAGFRRSIDRDEAIDPLPRGQDVAPADIVITDPTAPNGQTAPGVIANLVEHGPHGPLPRIGPEGQTPARAYAAAPPAGKGSAHRISILLGGMGLSTIATERAIAELPPAVSLAFAPYGRDVERLTELARQEGHEVMLQVPMEPYDFPDNDPGPQTLLTALDTEQNRDRLYWSMARFGGYVGVTNYMGARFTAVEEGMRPFLEELKARGLIYVEDGSSARSLAPGISREIGLRSEAADIVLDATPQDEAIEEALRELETIATRDGGAIGVATGLPVTIDTISNWAEGLGDRGFILVPVSTAVSGAAS